jgi:hypothetical protein
VKKGDEWTSESKVGITSDGYDYLNRVVGVTFFLPEIVHDEQGRARANPIHRKDYIYLRMGAVWYTPLGQLIAATEDVETDYNLVWMDARINSRSAQPVLQDGFPTFDAFGNPGLKLDPGDEMKALKTLSQLRTFGVRYAQTVARVRLLKMATGIRSLPIPAPKAFPIRVVGYRDRMEPEERIKKAAGDLATLYGSKPTHGPLQPLTPEELVTVGAVEHEEPEEMERELIDARQQTEEPKPADAPWTGDEVDAIITEAEGK